MLTHDAAGASPASVPPRVPATAGPFPENPQNITRPEALSRVRESAAQLDAVLRAHMDQEERDLLPMCSRLLSPKEQGELLVRCMHATVSVRHLPDAFRLVELDELAELFKALIPYCSLNDLRRIASAIADVLSVELWAALCTKVPKLASLVTPKHNPLIEIVQLHKAIGQELQDIVRFCESIDVTDQKQLQSLSARFRFLCRVHKCHSDGEDSVLIRELNIRLASSPCSLDATSFHEDHHDETALFEDFDSRLQELHREAAERSTNRDTSHNKTKEKELTKAVKGIADHIIGHMHEEETKILPLVRAHFTLEDQDRIMRLVMARVPSAFLHELIPWMFGYLSVNEQESMLRNLFRTAPRDEVRKVVGSIAESVRKGMSDRMEWNELLLRVPEIEDEYDGSTDKDDEEGSGPVSEILRVHKAFRIELNAILRRAKELPDEGSSPNPRTLASLAESVAFLRKMVLDHSQAEDDILLPRLEQRVPGISARYKDDHCDERKLFQDLAKCLEELRCASEETECARLVQKLQNVARTLLDEMLHHLREEEEHMWPHVRNLFTGEEQSEIVALIFGHMSCDRLRELLPWMIRMLSVSETHTMMNHILQVTQSTMFETWLKSWLPLEEESTGQDEKPPTTGGADVVGSGNAGKDLALSNGSDAGCLENSNSANTALVILRGKDNMERTLRSIARDASLAVEERTRMMQQVMLAPYNEVRANALAAERKRRKDEDDRSVIYRTDENGTKRLGCKHYLRASKMRASCCGRLYTCRLCHDDTEQTHIMDRTATTEILCMRCDTLQPVSASCINTQCRKRFSQYFCKVCVFFDDDERRSVYHCHSCNVCRVGKGLGQDFFHCMKCNQCMSMKYQQKGHRCIQNSMERDCPVCYQYLFTSTRPVKYLRCGHLMHVSCFAAYSKQCVSCPVCAKSLEEMKPLFQQIDLQLSAAGNMMPVEYRTARCDLYCMDCQVTNNTPYHFVYNKCPKCSSYNTRIERVDANATESDRSALYNH